MNDEMLKNREHPIDIPLYDDMPREGISSHGTRQGAMGKGRKTRGRMAKKNRKKDSEKSPRWMVWVIILAICVVAAHFTITTARDFCEGSLSIESKIITVAADASTADIASVLEQNGVVRNGFAFRITSRIMGYDGKYIQGEFDIKRGSGYREIMEQLTTTEGIQRRITIPEGYTIEQIADAIDQGTHITAEQFLDAVNIDYDFDFLPTLRRTDMLEGYLFPDTYNFSEKYTAGEMVTVMLRRFDDIFTDEFIERAEELDMSIDEVVILASIIEGEAGRDADRAKVSGVFHNRLNSKTYPYLESCATVQYILKERKPVLSTADTQIDSPYNTYINKGLPIGPICNPGEASIRAALYPEESDYMFFQSDADGKLYFAETLAEHESIRQEIQ